MAGSDHESSLPIPQVPKQYLGLLGNLPDIDPSFASKSFWRLQELYGDIYELDLLNRKAVIISNYELVSDVLDDNRYEKVVTGPLEKLRPFVKDALFTAFPEEPNWHKAHRILMPVFGPLAIRKMFPQMLDMASQLVLRWDRFGPIHRIACSDDFTRLAFDTIGLCAFGFRFNDFYSDNMHEFATQMTDVLVEAGKRASRTHLETQLRYLAAQKFDADIAAMHKLCDNIVEERINNPQPDSNDLLNVMLNQKDPETGEKLSRENIRYQMATFLVAGHETTSGTLSFLFYHLLHNPETYHKAQQEVDEILGDDTLTIDHIPKLKYIDACIKETLRFQSPITAVTRHAKVPTKLAGKYHVVPEKPIVVNLKGLHHDPKIWGDDHDQFKPERMLDFKKYPAGAWRPFGIGMRSCIGRAFAEQEMIMNVALILQRFQVTMADPSYHMELKSTLTVKPKDFEIKVRRRPGKSDMVGMVAQPTKPKKEEHKATAGQPSIKKPLIILYGSNAGSCKSYAEDLAGQAEEHGYAPKIATLDSACEHFTTDPVVVITASYEGRPTDNAKKFVTWLEASAKKDLLKGAKYSVFGVGNSEWATTYQKIPKLIDETLQKLGAERQQQAGFVDVKGDAIGPWEEWRDGLWKTLGAAPTAAPQSSLKIEMLGPDPGAEPSEAKPHLMTIKDNIQLADDAVGPQKMHMEVELPVDTTYRSGDYLVVYPYNHRDTVRRVLGRFHIPPEMYINITDTKKTFLQTPKPMTAVDLLLSRVELATPVAKQQLLHIASTASENEKATIEALVADDKYDSEVLPKRFSVLNILEAYPSCKLGFGEYLDMLKALSPRQYSISSSPLASMRENGATIASISYDVVESPSMANPKRTFHGVASTHLADCKPGFQVRAMVKPTAGAFRLPADSETPIIMVCAGSGIAPMRGFIQERAAIAKAAGKKLGPALLYFGCRDVNSDYIYRSELEQWEKDGVVSLRPCFSKRGPAGAESYRYTGDRLWAEREEAAKLFRDGAKIFVCGSASKIAKSTAQACKKIWSEYHPEQSDEDANAWFEEQREVRYVSDVYG